MPEMWSDILSAVLLAIAAYASTNVDNLVLLGALAAGTDRQRVVIAGFGVASVLILCVAMSFSLLSHLIAPRMLGWLGVLPIALGLRQLFFRGGGGDRVGMSQVSAQAVALLMLANSADTLAVFGSLFAESETLVVIVLALSFAVIAAVWAALVKMISGGSRRLSSITAAVSKAVPFIMIAIGTYVLLDTGTDLQ